MLTYGLKVTLLGMGTVFIALIILMGLIQVQSKLLIPKSSKQTVIPKEQTSVIEQPKTLQTVDQDDELEIAAVIAAAISACGHQVVVKNITRIYGNHGSAWAQSGRTEAMNLRQL